MVVTHITTSSEKCSQIRQHGIVGLVKAYEFQNSELRQFLKKHEINIDIEECCLTYKKELMIYLTESVHQIMTEKHMLHGP